MVGWGIYSSFSESPLCPTTDFHREGLFGVAVTSNDVIRCPFGLNVGQKLTNAVYRPRGGGRGQQVGGDWLVGHLLGLGVRGTSG